MVAKEIGPFNMNGAMCFKFPNVPHTAAQNSYSARRSMSHRTARPQMVSAISALVIRVNGSRAIKDVDLAILLGISLSELYKRIGDKTLGGRRRRVAY